jgi:hypothetical protein
MKNRFWMNGVMTAALKSAALLSAMRLAAAGMLLLCAAFMVLAGCGNDSTSGDPGGEEGDKTYAVGDTGPGGGRIFYVSEEGFTMTDNGETAHYLEAARFDIGETKAWASSEYIGTNIPGTEAAIGAGRKNTALILATDAAAPAAKACKDLTAGDKNDWFLPSGDELDQLSLNWRTALGGFSATERYWSSLQVEGTHFYSQAIARMFGSTQIYSRAKSEALKVRPIRAF